MTYKRRYADQTEQNAYENACDCHYFGMGSKDWEDCGIEKERRAKIWRQSWEDVANANY